MATPSSRVKCLLLGDDIDKIFSVTIEEGFLVSDLKEEIWKRRFRGSGLDAFSLWHVSFPTNDHDKFRSLVETFTSDGNEQHALDNSLTELSQVFCFPLDIGFLHILVQCSEFSAYYTSSYFMLIFHLSNHLPHHYV
jgi:hypothetical protein